MPDMILLAIKFRGNWFISSNLTASKTKSDMIFKYLFIMNIIKKHIPLKFMDISIQKWHGTLLVEFINLYQVKWKYNPLNHMAI